jgi:hypothetical protein
MDPGADKTRNFYYLPAFEAAIKNAAGHEMAAKKPKLPENTTKRSQGQRAP